MEPKHSAIAAGLALTLAFGSVAAPKPAVAEDTTSGVASDATNIDKGLYTEQSLAGTLRSVSGVNLVNVSDEMKYFTKYESHGNYNQGFSYGDGYNALGYYQFDRRWSLIPFMRQVYNYNPAKYSMLKTAIDRGSEISSSSNVMYSNGQLTELGRIAQDAFQGAYAADPVEFSALQDSYAYNSYYAVTESWLKSSLGIDISGRADCVKGMVWSITNMCGTGGCQDFFRWANLSNGMTDREFVTALSNSVVNNVARKYPKQTQYHAGWQNRYRSELKDCLAYIAEDEAAAAAKPSEPAGDAGNGADSGSDSGSNAGSNDAISNDDASNDDSLNDASHDSAVSGSVSNGVTSGSSNGDSSNATSSADNVDSKTDDASSGSAADGANGAPNATDSDSKADDKTEAGSTDSKGSDESEGKGDSKDSDGETKDETSSASKNDESDAEKLGEAVGDALTSGLSKAESESKSSDGKDDASKTQKSSDDSSAQDDKSSDNDKMSDKKKDEQKQDAQKQDEQKKDGNAATPTSADKSANGNNKTTTNGGMPRTGDIVIMASLASASLATFGMTAIVSGKNKLKGQDENDSGDNGQA